MRFSDLSKEAIKITPLQMPLPVSQAFRLLLETHADFLPVLEFADYLKGVYLADILMLMLKCQKGRACSSHVPTSFLREVPFIDTSGPEHSQIDKMKEFMEAATSVVLLSHGSYVGIVPFGGIVNFIHKHQLIEAVATSPLTGLPGNISIKKEFGRRMAEGGPFYMCYCDLNDFKPFNDKYGVPKGDDVIRFTAFVLTDTCQGNFVGHIGGDDFIFYLPSHAVHKTIDDICKTFDSGIGNFYSSNHREQGGIMSIDREGRPRVFPIMSAAFAAVLVENNIDFDQAFTSIVEGKDISKKKCKEIGGSYATIIEAK